MSPSAHVQEHDDLEAAALSRSRRRRVWLVAAVLTALVLAIGIPLLGPSPPRHIVFAGGQAGGFYASLAHEYQARLGRVGLQVSVVESSGSVDNLERLLRGDVDVALVQSGASAVVPGAREKLRGLAALYFEPLWVFHRYAALTSFAQLRGGRLSIGPAGSGTEAVAKTLLREYGMDNDAVIVNASTVEAGHRLLAGELDAALFVTTYRDDTVLELLRAREIHLFGFRRDAAHARKLAPLQALKLPEGVVDLRRNIPAQDTTLLAVPALLVSRADLHPRVVEQLLKVAQVLHRPGSLIDPPMRFPSLDGVDLEPHEAAQVYLTDGESLLSRTLPYDMLRWVLMLRVLALPLIVWLPLLRLLPEVTKWRVERRLGHLYAMLRRAERAAAAAEKPDELRERIEMLDHLATSAEGVWRKLPESRQRDVYNWRVHIALVRGDAAARLAAMEQPARGSYADTG